MLRTSPLLRLGCPVFASLLVSPCPSLVGDFFCAALPLLPFGLLRFASLYATNRGVWLRPLTVLAALAHLWLRPSVECGSPHLQSRLLLPTVALSYLRCLRCSPQSSAQCKIPSIRRLPAECRSHPCLSCCWVATPPGIWFGGFSPLRFSLQLLAFPLAVGSSDGLITYRRRYLHHCLSYPVAGLGCHCVISTLPLGVWEQQQQH